MLFAEHNNKILHAVIFDSLSQYFIVNAAVKLQKAQHLALYFKSSEII